MLKPIHIENEELFIHPFRPEDLDRFGQLSEDLFSILSDDHTLKFIPTKRLHNIEEAELLLKNIILNFHSGRSYVHFITQKSTGKLIGLIDWMLHYDRSSAPGSKQYSQPGCQAHWSSRQQEKYSSKESP